MYGGWLPILLPALTGSSLHGREQNTASGAAGVRPDINHALQEVEDAWRKPKNIQVRWADAFALLSCPTPETGKSKFSPLPAFPYYLVNGICHIYKHNVNNIN
ncbi:hypothetical protein UH29_24320 [Escherichia coli]|nr:hypothetical protein UH28_24345 [Escherichia coli]KIZ70149.1 hypothetical protein UH32_24445 [Escherichia coli]KIZ78129.1 hypothetical protein UH29_24320 [Escherichia coli]KIZ85952.1 hypothetical protein UH33_24080 [Escherichia coli]